MDRHEAAAVATDETLREAEVEDHLDGVGAVRVLRNAHAPHKDGRPGVPDQLGELTHAASRHAGLRLELFPAHSFRLLAEAFEAGGVTVDERFVVPAVLEQDLQRPEDEGDVAADVDGKPVVADRRAEKRRTQRRRDPIPLHRRLPVGIHEDNPGALLLGQLQVLDGYRLVVRGVGAEEDDQVGSNPIGVAAGRGGDPERGLHRRRRGRVADPGGVVDVVGAEEAGDLLRHVVDLVGQPPRGQVKGQALRVRSADALGDPLVGLGPVDTAEPRVTPLADHRIGETAELAQLSVLHVSELRHVIEQITVEAGHRVEAEQIEARRAEVDPPHRPIVEAGGAKRTPVACPAAQHPPCVAEVVTVLQRDLEDVAVVLGLGAPEPEGDQVLEMPPEGTADLVCHQCSYSSVR